MIISIYLIKEYDQKNIEGPTWNSIDPAFPTAEATALIEVKKSTPNAVNKIEPTVKI